MICLTCNIPCKNICPCCLESVFSYWHNTEDAKKFAKKIKNGDIDVTLYIEAYKEEVRLELKKEKRKNMGWWNRMFSNTKKLT